MQNKAKINRNGNETSIVIESGQTVLEAMISADLDPPFLCKSGTCGTCKAKLVSGRVNMKRHFALDDTQLASGIILCCQSISESDEIEVVYE